MPVLKRISAGQYRTEIDGEPFAIYRNTERSSSWFGEWIIRSERDAYSYSDPLPTLEMCKIAVNRMETERRLTRAIRMHWEIVVYFARREIEVQTVNRHPNEWYSATYIESDPEHPVKNLTHGWRYVGRVLWSGGFLVIGDNTKKIHRFLREFENFDHIAIHHHEP